MQNKNNFTQELRYLFDVYECWWCRKNRADSLHHIVGRGSAGSTVEQSILNAAPLCNYPCHIPNHAVLRGEENIKKLLAKTYSFLIQQGYSLTDIDDEFIYKYVDYY